MASFNKNATDELQDLQQPQGLPGGIFWEAIFSNSNWVLSLIRYSTGILEMNGKMYNLKDIHR